MVNINFSDVPATRPMNEAIALTRALSSAFAGLRIELSDLLAFVNALGVGLQEAVISLNNGLQGSTEDLATGLDDSMARLRETTEHNGTFGQRGQDICCRISYRSARRNSRTYRQVSWPCRLFL